MEAIGIGASFGVAVGGAMATTGAGAMAVVQGVAKGIAQTSQPTLNVPMPPAPLALTTRTRKTGRSSSEERPRLNMATCVACHTPNRGHKGHLYSGDCIGFPGRALADLPTTSPIEMPVPTGPVPPLTDDLTKIIEDADDDANNNSNISNPIIPDSFKSVGSAGGVEPTGLASQSCDLPQAPSYDLEREDGKAKVLHSKAAASNKAL